METICKSNVKNDIKNSLELMPDNELTSKQFENYINNLEFSFCNETQIGVVQDEVGQILTYNIPNSKTQFSDTAFFNEVEYLLTQSQKQEIAIDLDNHIQLYN